MRIRSLFACLLATTMHSSVHGLPTLNYNEGYQLYTTFYPTSILNQQAKEFLKTYEEPLIKERVQFSASFYAEKATTARDLNKQSVFLGDVHGRLNMIGLTYGAIPIGATEPALLQTAGAQTFKNAPLLGVPYSNPTYSDPTQQFGFFSAPLKYNKEGLRFQGAVRFLNDFVFTIQGGVADLKQTTTGLIDQTPNSVYSNVYPSNATLTPTQFALDQAAIEQYFMEPSEQIFQQLNVFVGDIQRTGPEDVSLLLEWRHNFDINEDADPRKWAHFIFTPFIQLGSTLGVAQAKDPNKLFDLPLGNNKHTAIQLSGGVGLDFAESIEVTGEIGCAYFLSRTYTTRVPTHQLQSMLFPYATAIKENPGNTWYFALGMNAYHFLDNLTIYAQFMYVNHQQDSITLLKPDPAFIPTRLAQDTPFKTQLGNFGANYDISPNFSLGLAWQWPLARRGAYKTNVLLVNVSLTY